MKELFVNGIGMVNSQFIDHLTDDFLLLTESITQAQTPSLKELISPAMSRRMANGVKMGIYAAHKALNEAEMEQPEAIITGTALGCLVDSEKFLTNVLQNKEEFLTPTAFIQSTHNTVAGQIALQFKCNSYNFTYTNGFNSFENALSDAVVQMELNEINNALIGGIDEIGKRTYELQQFIGEIEAENNNGAKYSEGAHFFVVSTEKTAQSYAKIKAVSIRNSFQENKLVELIQVFLKENQLELSSIDAIITGIDSVKNNHYIQSSTECFTYKEFIGEYGTSSAFGLVLACVLLKEQALPNQFKKNDFSAQSYKNVLLINGRNEQDLSFVLVEK